MIFDVMGIVQYWIDRTTKHTIWVSANNAKLLVWDICQLLIYTLLFLRLYHSFDGTRYAISKRIYTIFIILFILYVLVMVTILIGTIIVVVDEEQAQDAINFQQNFLSVYYYYL